MALMHLLADWTRSRQGAAPVILTVDHGLRAESENETAKVAAWARKQGLAAHVLRWRGAKPQTGIEEKARKARYRLLGEWCAANGVNHLFVAHTLEDQAETFLLRLGRGSGVDGLSGMKPRAAFPIRGFPALELLRPLLDFRRAELRAYLAARSAGWLDDPMNVEERFFRARLRKLLPVLDAAGLPTARIAEAAKHLARAREALDLATEHFLAHYARLDRNFAVLDSFELAKLPGEIGLRALSKLLMNFMGATYRPRFEKLQNLFDAIIGGDFAARTLAGCRIGRAPKAQAIFGPGSLVVSRQSPRNAGAQSPTAALRLDGISLPDTVTLL
jgi:tRNA(Ile)-lysidine synthase